jgi:peroxiredoxin
VAQLASERERFRAAGARAVLVGMGTPAQCRSFIRQFEVPFPIIADPERALYQQFHLERMSPLRVLSPATMVKGVAALAHGHLPGAPQGDVLQLPGVFVIGAGDRVCRAFAPADPAGHPSPDDILKAVADCPGGRATAST